MQGEGYHYTLMRRAIAVIDSAAGREMTLQQIAAEVNLSPAHFQRLFSRWAGVSPKRFQQYLVLGHAKRLLDDRHTTLDTALAAGLSGGGRLHDLFVAWEAMSPGDYARRGAGLTVFWGWFESPFGPALVMGTAKGLCGIGLAAEHGEAAVMADLIGRWPRADFVEDPSRLRAWAQHAFGLAGSGADPAPMFLIGAPFQLQVWQALLRIPTGHVTTYGTIAAHLGRPTAVRAVGTAVGRNPLGWLIPCHRVLRASAGADGHLGGYHWGLSLKRTMLAQESAETAL